MTNGDEEVLFSDGVERNFLYSFVDFRFRKLTSPSTLQLLFAVLVVGLAVGAVYGGYEAFQQSTAAGWWWTLLIGPVAFIVGVLTARVFIEILLAILLLTVHLGRVVENTSDISAQTLGLPTLPIFHRSIRKDKKAT